ncbi:MAG: hypothetical protein J6A59_14095 [Lachnospiraceae bacterium]|nr:hypothetical protein [Lachnospiraceae bacterium]
MAQKFDVEQTQVRLLKFYASKVDAANNLIAQAEELEKQAKELRDLADSELAQLGTFIEQLNSIKNSKRTVFDSVNFEDCDTDALLDFFGVGQ